jgi:hypothetical protein
MLGMLTGFITILYYALVGYISIILLYNLVKSKTWDRDLLYIVVVIPFLLRLFMLK